MSVAIAAGTAGDVPPTSPGCRPLRIAVVAESFLPQVNGVSNTVVKLLEHAAAAGHDAMVIAPSPGADEFAPYEVVRVPSVALPGYPEVRVARRRSDVEHALRHFRPDVVHLASPAVLGAFAVSACRRIGIPSVAIFQTDLVGYARRYHMSAFVSPLGGFLRGLHNRADVTLAPSTSFVDYLRDLGVHDVRLWPRGVDAELFDPSRRCDDTRRLLGAPDRVIVGYVGRLAREKEVERLAVLSSRDDVALVVVGAGPCEEALRDALPTATFLGLQRGADLARIVASLDVFVHTGLHETFCQTVQEALACGVPVVAPAVGGPLDTVRDGVNGLLWYPDRPQSLAEAVGRLVEDGRLRARLASAARPSVESRTWGSVMDSLFAEYRSVLARAAR